MTINEFSNATNKGLYDNIAANRAITPEEQQRFAKIEADDHLANLDSIEEIYEMNKDKLSEEDRMNFEETIKFDRVETIRLMEQAGYEIGKIRAHLTKETEKMGEVLAESQQNVETTTINNDSATLNPGESINDYTNTSDHVEQVEVVEETVVPTDEVVLPDGFDQSIEGSRSR